MPVPTPITTPQISISCQSSVMPKESRAPPPIITSAVVATARMPKRFMKAAAKGPKRPKNTRRIASAEEISAVVQPNSCSSGPIKTPAEPMAPAVASMIRKVVPATTQP